MVLEQAYAYFLSSPADTGRNFSRECPHGVIVKAMDCRIIVSDFELQLLYYVNLQTNTLQKDMKPLILSAMG